MRVGTESAAFGDRLEILGTEEKRVLGVDISWYEIVIAQRL